MAISEERLQALWEEIKRRIKESGDINRPLWSALDAAQVITLDYDTDPISLVIGLDGEDYHLAGHLEVSENWNLVDRIMKSVANRPLVLKVIQGATLQDYQFHKQREAEAARFGKVQQQQRLERRKSRQVLEDVAQEFHRRFSTLPVRHLSQVRAQFLLDCLDLLSKAVDEIGGLEDEPDEVKQKQVDRIIERLANLVEMPPTFVALELARYRRKQ